jgi:hypothetical protein
MDTTLLSAISAVLGSLVGGTATAATTWLSQKTLTKRELMRDEMRKREALYGDFIGECAKLLMDALGHTLEKPETLLAAYALLNRIRLSSSPAVLAEAEKLLKQITGQYFAANLSVEDLRRQLEHAEEVDPLKGFGAACRAEIESMRRGL